MMDSKEPRLTHASLKVLRVFLDSGAVKLPGAEIHKQSGVLTGTLYPLLLRFEAAGWLKSEWEDIDPKEAGRPRKRFYWLTPTGRARANAALASVSPSGEVVSWT
jgi:PadR family transcriptional regulator, regulatory protein PadR